MDTSATKNCFVIIGYGDKIDLASQRRLNLDRVFENIIKPAFDSFEEPKFKCFRACDENYSGVIDVQMYKWIYEADFVIADISTLNPNAIYELGIRHALRPYSTVVIAEDGIKEFPFDISHVKIEKYKHLGEDIGVGEAKRFINILRTKIQQMLDNQICDSPVYTFMQKLKPPYFEMLETENNGDLNEPQVIYGKAPEASEVEGSMDPGERVSLTELLKMAEKEVSSRNFLTALNLYKEAEQRDLSNVFIKHRIILATYKSEHPDKETSLQNAIALLSSYFDTELTIDTRTLDLIGVTNKRLAELEYEKGPLCSVEKALALAYRSVDAWEKAYILSDSFFIGGNYANVLLVAALFEPDLKIKYQLFIRSSLVWQRVYDTTKKILTKSESQAGKLTRKRGVVEKNIQAKLVLTNGVEDDEMRSLKAHLGEGQSDYQRDQFLDRTNKSMHYVNEIKNSLKNLDRKDMFL